MSILNSVSRGFGFTIGNKMANSVVNGLSQSNGEYKQSPSLSGRQIFKTIMWGFVMIFLSILITSFVWSFGMVGPKGAVVMGAVLTVLFIYVIGKGYYKENVSMINSVNRYNEIKSEKERLTKETEDSYISGGINKREYEVLMKRINKM
jgi:uncharacterized membrane protein